MINVGILKSIRLKIFVAIIKIINRTATRTLSGITLYKIFIDQIELDKKG